MTLCVKMNFIHTHKLAKNALPTRLENGQICDVTFAKAHVRIFIFMQCCVTTQLLDNVNTLLFGNGISNVCQGYTW